MGAEDLMKKLKRKKSSQLAHKANQVDKLSIKKTEMKMKKKKNKLSSDIADKVDAEMLGILPNIQEDETQKSSGEKKLSRNSRNKKTRNGKKIRASSEDLGDPQIDEVVDGVTGERSIGSEPAEDKLQIGKKKRKNSQSVKKADVLDEQDEAELEDHIQEIVLLKRLDKADKRRNSKTGKSKSPGKTKKKNRSAENKVSPDNLLEIKEDTQDDVYEMSSGDEDNSKGMKKWITQYHQSRPGLKLLQEKIDDFIMSHEAKEEEARVARESHAAEGGWTVVVHHKGRKKTTDAESGIAMGSVAQAVVEDKLANKKTKGVGLDFYRFQKREANRNEIMMLQSKFEQDKKRIQQLRAARKFRPY